MSDKALTKAQLVEFIGNSSNFAFEMSTLRLLRSAGFDAAHGATYVDSVTKKIRAYDFRAQWAAQDFGLRLAVECKSLHESAPLLIHATPRLESESYHCLVKREKSGGYHFQSAVRVAPKASIYEIGMPVGRQLDQPSRGRDGSIKSADGDTFDRWMQAVHGCADLLQQTVSAQTQLTSLQAILPILVVPEGRIWQVDYDEDGSTGEPLRQVDRTTLILRHKWTAATHMGSVDYDVSHLEIITLPALVERLDALRGNLGLFERSSHVLRG